MKSLNPLNWFSAPKGPTNFEVSNKLDLVLDKVADLNKNLNDVFFIATEEASKYHESIKAIAKKNEAVDTGVMLKSVSAMYVEAVNDKAMQVAGFKQLLTAMVMKVGAITLSKELQVACYNKTFTLMVDEDGDAHLGVEGEVTAETFESLPEMNNDEDIDCGDPECESCGTK